MVSWMEVVTELKGACTLLEYTVSGDLTDAKTFDGEGSTQYEAEWILYKDVLEKNNVTKKVLWLDIRGNHG